MAMTRRQFLKRAAASGAAAGLAPGFKWFPGTNVSYASGPSNAVVVFVQLYGGNDGINTVYPVSGGQRSLYDEFRPTLGLPDTDAGCAARAAAALFGSPTVLSLGPNDDGSTYALHPAMSALHGVYTAGKLAVIPGVHYPFADHSHFRSEVIWYTLDPLGSQGQGWFGHYLNDSGVFSPNDVPGIMLGDSLSPVFTPTNTSLLAFNRLSELRFPADGELALKQAKFSLLYSKAAARGASFPELVSMGNSGAATVAHINDYYQPGAPNGMVEALLVDVDGNYDPDNPLIYTSPLNETDNPAIQGMGLARDLKHVAAIIRSQVGARFFHVATGGFDSHSSQERDFYHSSLLAEVSESLAAFYNEMANGSANPGGGYLSGDISSQVIVVTFSEFGRTIRQNAQGATSAGTDHGSSIPVFVLGGAVTGGASQFVQPAYAHPAFDDPGDNDDDLKVSNDFRDVFGTILNRWLNVPLAQLDPPGPTKILPATLIQDHLGRDYTTFTPLSFLSP
jgi:uncharacterized protein (DUF1501 family)